jgi:hypothetical protein
VINKSIRETEEPYFTLDFIVGTIEINKNTLALAFLKRDYIKIVDRKRRL